MRIESRTLALDLVEALTAGQNGRLSLALVVVEQARRRRVVRPPGSWLVPLAVRLRLGLPFGRLERAKTVGQGLHGKVATDVAGLRPNA
ncbi:hypothetical protein D3C71_1372760 [compost metagenome]